MDTPNLDSMDTEEHNMQPTTTTLQFLDLLYYGTLADLQIARDALKDESEDMANDAVFRATAKRIIPAITAQIKQF